MAQYVTDSVGGFDEFHAIYYKSLIKKEKRFSQRRGGAEIAEEGRGPALSRKSNNK